MAHWFCPLWAGSNFLRNQGVRLGIRPNKSHGLLAPDSTLQSTPHQASKAVSYYMKPDRNNERALLNRGPITVQSTWH